MSLSTEHTSAISVIDVSIVIPTFREAENLPVLIPRIAEVMTQSGFQYEIIVVDDNSPDETVSICTTLAAQIPLRLEVRTQDRGLSSAVIHGLHRAEGTVLLVMDADLSHPPEKIPELVASLDDPQVDFVIGSRYVDGGKTDDRWSFFRWLNSQAATLLARPFTTARDPMAGFFALRRTTFQNAAPLNPIGYKIGLELLVKCGCSTVREVPIYFQDRLHGESKLNLREQLNYVRHLLRLGGYKFGMWLQPLLFAIVGLSGMAVDLLSFQGLLMFASPSAARALSIWIAMTWNFFGNRSLTFPESRKHSLAWQYALFCGGCIIGGIVNWSISVALFKTIPFFATHVTAAAALGAVAGAVFNYIASVKLAFRR